MRRQDFTGRRFGRLTAISFFSVGKTSKWVCKCDCGKISEVAAQHLKSGHTKSCGCLEIENRFSASHNKSRTKTYGIYMSMIQRCRNKNCRSYKNYGGRGIKVCDRWLGKNGFTNFYNDMGDSNGLTIDRINNDGNYEPGNCRWATYSEQNNNLKTNVIIQIGDESMTATQWSRISGVPAHLIRYRFQNNWSNKDSVFLPVKRGQPYKMRALQA